MSKPEIILIGGGGHCKSCIDVIEHENKFSIAGIIDVKEKVGQTVLGYSIIGCDDDIDTISKNYNNFLITVGQLKSPNLRIRLFEKIKSLNKALPIIVSPNAYISKHTEIGEGTIIMNNAVLNASSSIGENCIINTRALIEHDVSIGNHCHISTSVTINGECKISDNVFIGSKTVIVQEIEIEKNTFIGAGSVVIKNLTSGKYFGNPAKPY
ncbi:MAG: acetyltransferase [Flavobacteriales bacterium]|nr:MAG: acetyltransferase [Flavobacteriales bacterium]